MKLLPVFLLVLAIVTVECRRRKIKDRIRAGKNIAKSEGKLDKGMVKLCDALDTGTVEIDDEAYQSIFDEVLPGYCETMWQQLKSSPSKNGRKCDGVKELERSCKTYNKINKEPPTSGPWMGFDAVCDATELASSRSLLDRKSKKMQKKITKYCGAVSAGGEVFGADDDFLAAEVGAFCDAFLLENLPESVGSQNIDAVGDLAAICAWYTDKFADVPAEGVLGQLTSVCVTLSDGLLGVDGGSGDLDV